MIRDHIYWIRLLCVAILCGVQNYSFGQTEEYKQYIATPSPHAMSLAKFAITPVNLHNGSANVNIPICNLSGINVSLSYQTSGIKMQDVAGPVGLGWTLNAGGAITRIVRGKPDEDAANGWCGTNKIGNKVAEFINAQGNSNLGHFANGTWDSEPDLFHFNVGGWTGTFVLTAEGHPLLLPHKDIKIRPAIGVAATQNYWTIITPDGTQYRFGKSSNATEESESKTNLTNSPTHTYTATWYLSEIVRPDNSMVTFTYRVGGDVSYKTYYENLYNSVSYISTTREEIVSTTHKVIENTVTTKAQKTIARIDSEDGAILFSPGLSNRLDIDNAKYLSTIIKTNKSGSVLESFQLNYSYFMQGNDVNTRRLKLTTVKQPGIPAYHFTYNALSLPARNSFQIDHWGYYNNNTYQYAGKYSAILPYINPQTNIATTGADRSMDAARSQACMLQQIQYPTGGYTSYEYEPNSFLDASGTEIKGGGLRISKMLIHDGIDAGKDQTYHYTYVPEGGNKTSGVLNGWYPYIYSHATGHRAAIPGGGVGSKHILRYSNPLTFWTNGLHSIVGYSCVQVHQELIGKKVYKYRTFKDSPDILPQKRYYSTSNERSILADSDPPFTPPSTRFWQRGLLSEEKILNELGVIRNHKIYAYAANPTQGTIKALTGITQYTSSLGTFNINYGVYDIISEGYLLSKIENYDYTDNQTQLKTMTNYTYGGSFHQFPTQTEVINPDGSYTVTKNVYPKDYSSKRMQNPSASVTAIQTMQTNHLISPVIETTVWTKPTASAPLVLQKGTISEYASQNGTVNLHKVFNFESASPVTEAGYTTSNTTSTNVFNPDSRYKETGSFWYDAYNKLVAFNKKQGPFTSIIWGETIRDGFTWKTTRPVAEVTNAATYQVGYASFETYTSGEFSGIGLAYTENIWLYYGTIDNQDYVTGQQSFRGTVTANVHNQSPIHAGEYYLSYWAKGSGNVTVNGIAQTATSDWKYYQTKLTLTTNGSITLNTGNAKIDELRLYPVGALMKTFTYKHGVGVSSINSPQNVVTYYEYDFYNRLKRIKDNNRNIVKLMKYEYHTDFDFTYTLTSNHTVALAANVSESLSALGYTYHWNFGDFSSLITTSKDVTHTYVGYDAVYTVTLELRDAQNNLVKTVNRNVVASSLSGGTSGSLSFTASASVPQPKDFLFVVNGGSLTGDYEYVWSFGDGNIAITQNASIRHAYTLEDFYQVNLLLRRKSNGKTLLTYSKDIVITIGDGEKK